MATDKHISVIARKLRLCDPRENAKNNLHNMGNHQRGNKCLGKSL
jgi:hypothetical protein